jgi:hypothetical protein
MEGVSGKRHVDLDRKLSSALSLGLLFLLSLAFVSTCQYTGKIADLSDDLLDPHVSSLSASKMYLAADDPDAPKTGMPANARVRGMKLEEHMQSVLQGMSGSHVSETPNGNVLSPRTQLYVPSEDPDSPSGYDRKQLSPLDRKLNQRLQVMHTMDAELKLKADVKEMELEPKSASFGKNSEMMLNLKSSKPGHIFDGDDAAARDDRKISKEVAEENGDGLLDHEVDKERKQRRSWSQGIQDAKGPPKKPDFR